MTDILHNSAGLTATQVPTGTQWLLHGHPDEAAALATAIGLHLPTENLTGAITDAWTALHLSPDEWLLMAPEGSDGDAQARRMASGGVAGSLVDVSDRSLAIEISGDLATDALAGACPLDLERLPDGCCTRTLFGKITVLLRRVGDRWRIDYPRSFDGYVRALLAATCRDAMEVAASA